MPTMEYANVRLRPWRPVDAEELIAIAKCAHVQAWLQDWADVEEWASLQEENQASRAVLERTGFSLSHSSPTVFPGFDEAVSCAWYVRKR